MSIACWKSKTTRAHTCTRAHAPAPTYARTHTDKYVILIDFPQQQWLRERATVLHLCKFRVLFSRPSQAVKPF